MDKQELIGKFIVPVSSDFFLEEQKEYMSVIEWLKKKNVECAIVNYIKDYRRNSLIICRKFEDSDDLSLAFGISVTNTSSFEYKNKKSRLGDIVEIFN